MFAFEIAVEYLNNSYATFLGDVIKSYGYKVPDSYDPNLASHYYESNMLELPHDKVSKIKIENLNDEISLTCWKP